MKIIISLLSLIILFSVLPTTTFAQMKATPDCQPIYGGGETCLQTEEISVNLQFKNPSTGGYVENLKASGTTFSPIQPVNYKVIVKNTVKRDLSNVTVTIIFPQLVEYVSGTGKFDAKTRKLTFPIEKLKPNESKVFFINGKIAAKDKFTTQSTTCTFTQVMGTFEKKVSQDNSQFCISPTTTVVAGATSHPNITKGGLAVYPPSNTKTTPQTGPEAFALIGLLPAGAVGFWLRRQSAH